MPLIQPNRKSLLLVRSFGYKRDQYLGQTAGLRLPKHTFRTQVRFFRKVQHTYHASSAVTVGRLPKGWHRAKVHPYRCKVQQGYRYTHYPSGYDVYVN